MKQWLPQPLQGLARLVSAKPEQHYQTILDCLADAALIYDEASYRFLYANPAAEALLGYTRDELCGLTPIDLHPPEDHHLVQRRLQDDSDCGAHLYQLARKDGSLVPVEIHSNAITYAGRQAYVSVLRDVSMREQGRRQVAELARLAAEAPTPILRLAGNGAVLYANQAARRILPQDEDGSLCAPRVWIAWVRDALRAEKSVHAETQTDERTCLLTFVPVVGRGYVNVYSVDITERNQAREQLRQERDLAEGLINTAPAIVLLLTPDGHVVRANAFAERVLGHTLQDLAGQDWFETLVPEPDREAARQAFQRAADGEVVSGHENRVYTADGGSRVINWDTATLYDAQGAVSGVLAVGHDVTERQQLEARLRLAQKMEAVGQLAGGVAHDFNNLLQVINGNAEFALMDPSLPDQCRRDIAEISRAGRRASELTSQLLAYARQQTAHPTPVDLIRLLEQMRATLERIVGEGIDVVLALSEATPHAMADEAQLEQALLNLTLNARDAMPDGGRLTISAEPVTLGQTDADLLDLEPGRYALMQIRDNGMGMDKATLERVFEPFFTTKEVGEGTGLGLAQVYGIVSQCAGTISVQSAPGEGTAFRLYLPAAGEAPPSPAPHEPDERDAAKRGNGETILIAEDDNSVRHLACRLLSRLGYHILQSSGVAEALAIAEQYQGAIDLLLTDVIMRDGTGVECARQLRAARPGIAVLYMSGYAEDAARLADSAPAGDLLHKPFTLPQIAAAVQEALQAAAPGVAPSSPA